MPRRGCSRKLPDFAPRRNNGVRFQQDRAPFGIGGGKEHSLALDPADRCGLKVCNDDDLASGEILGGVWPLAFVATSPMQFDRGGL